MNIDQFFEQTIYAIDTLFTVAFHEQRTLNQLEIELKRLEHATNDGYERAHFLALNPDLDDDNLGTAIHFDTYFGVDKDRDTKSRELKAQKERMETLGFSIELLFSCILQYAHQALKIQFGDDRSCCPDGRSIKGFPLVDFIWHGRNQAAHWESAPHKKTAVFFNSLCAVDSSYNSYLSEPLARKIIKDLDWKCSSDLKNDILRLK